LGQFCLNLPAMVTLFFHLVLALSCHDDLAQDFNIRCGCTLLGLRDDIGKAVGRFTRTCHNLLPHHDVPLAITIKLLSSRASGKLF
jgi:hypothetical protein